MKPRRLHQKHQLQIFKEDTTMTNIEKAKALINTFATGDTEKAKELLAKDLETPKDTEGKRRILRGAGKSHQRWHCMAPMWRLIE